MDKAVVLLAGIMLCVGAAGGARAAELVGNGSFEVADPTDDARPLGFLPGRVAPSEGNVRLTWEQGGNSGARSVAVETTDSSGNGYWETTVPVTPATQYTISLFYKCRDAAFPAATTGDPEYNKGRPGGPNLELGAVPDASSAAAEPTHWTDIGIPVGPLGGSYLPVATEWWQYRQQVVTRPEQTKLRIRLRLYCYAQKVWFDDLSVVEGPGPADPSETPRGWVSQDVAPLASAPVPIQGPTRPELRGQTLYVNGKPFFPIGLYAYCCTPTDGRFREEALAEATAAGYNCLLNTTLVPPADTVEDLDMLSKHGMYGLLNISTDMRGATSLDAAREAIVVKGQGQWAGHPSVIGYWADDPENLEDTSGGPIPPTTLAMLEHTRRALSEHTPGYPLVWAISNLPRLAPAAPTADILLSYRYPVPQYHPQMVYGYTIAYARSVIGAKPLWFNSQGFDLGYGAKFGSEQPFRPTPEEMRAMAFYSIIEGVGGWSLYGCSLSRETQPEHWAEAMRIGRELRALAPTLAEGTTTSTVRLRPGPLIGSVYYRQIEHLGTHTLLAVNMSSGSFPVTWELPEHQRLTAPFEGRCMAEAATQVEDVFRPYEVHIYRW